MQRLEERQRRLHFGISLWNIVFVIGSPMVLLMATAVLLAQRIEVPAFGVLLMLAVQRSIACGALFQRWACCWSRGRCSKTTAAR